MSTSSTLQQQSQSGRNQLKDLLNDLVLQTTEENKESSPLEVDEDVEEAARELLEYSSPRKIHSLTTKHRKNRKRYQRTSTTNNEGYPDDDSSCTSVNEPAIMIYGRHLNLSRLPDDSSLYSAGREWVRNDPHGGQHHRNECTASTESDSEVDLYSHPLSELSTTSTSYSCCPSPLKVDTDKMDKSLQSGVPDTQIHLLKQEHLKRWKLSRERDRDSYNKKQAKYTEMIKVLQETYQVDQSA